MATETAPPPPATLPRHYWQLPTFALGVAAAVCAWVYVPAPTAAPAAGFRAALDQLAEEIEKRPADLAAVEALVRRLAESAGQSPAEADQAHFLLGSGCLVLAEHGPPASAADNWSEAGRHFTRCDPTRLTDKDAAKRFTYRSAKAAAALGTGDPPAIFTALNQPPLGEDLAEAPRLIAETCLRLTPPDLKRATDELTRYLSLPNRSGPAVTGRYKLILSGLYAKLNEPVQSRRWLADIGSGAPADVLAAAKAQLGRLAAAENNWAEAAKHFEAAQAVAGLPDDQKNFIRYQTGNALLRLGNPAQAGPYLEQASKDPGAIGAAAAVRLAELRVQDPAAKGRRADAAALLEKAVASVKGANDFAAADVPPAEVRSTFEEVIKRSLAEADYASAVRAATAYAAIAENGQDKQRRAEANAAWADALEKTNPADAKPKHRAAAVDFAGTAASMTTPAARAGALRRAVTHFRQAGATAEALDAATAILVLKDAPPEDIGQAWLDKAELLPPAETAAVTDALQKAMTSPGPVASAARLRLAVHHLTRGKQLLDAAPGALDPAKAKQSGEQMVKLGRDMLVQIADAATVAPVERPTHEEAVFQLGSQLMTEGKFADAEARFRKQVQLYTDGKLVGYARLWLACCLVQQGHTGGPADKRLQEAIDLLNPLLSSPVEFLRTQAEIRTLNTLVVQQRYDQVVKLGDDLSKKYRGRPDELVIGKLLFYSHLNRTPPEPGEALRVLLRMEEAFKEVPPAAFPADPEYSHARWQKDLPTLRQELEKRKQ